MLGEPAAVSRLQREARALSRLNHPDIAAVYDFDTKAGVSFHATEYVSGRGVSDVVERVRRPRRSSSLSRSSLPMASWQRTGQASFIGT